MEKPLISICIPAYQRLDYLREAVASALAQTYPNLEIIISQKPGRDANMTDEIRQWGESLAQENEKVCYQQNSTNLGMAGNWNALVDAAKGDYLTILADDDHLLPTFIEALVTVAEAETQVVFCNQYLMNPEGKHLETDKIQYTKRYCRNQLPAGKVTNPKICAWQQAISISASLIRTKSAKTLRFKDDLPSAEVEFFIRLAQAEGNFIFVPEYLSKYRVHPQSTSGLFGLGNERLFDYLVTIPVSSEIEPYKRNLLSNIIVNAASCWLLQGQVQKAMELLKSEYYPEAQRTSISGLVQSVCTLLPPALSSSVYRYVHIAKHRLA